MAVSSELIDPVAFVRSGRPPSSNRNLGKRGEGFQGDIARLYRDAGGALSDEHRYGIAYYFVRSYRPTNDLDAGNLGKRIWDALEGVAYRNDEVVRLQITGVVETEEFRPGEVALQQLDLSNIPKRALDALLWLVGQKTSHILYVEIGPIRPRMLSFGLT